MKITVTERQDPQHRVDNCNPDCISGPPSSNPDCISKPGRARERQQPVSVAAPLTEDN